MFGGQSNEEWIAKYERSHQHPSTRLCHTYGIPTILVSVAFLLPDLFVTACGG